MSKKITLTGILVVVLLLSATANVALCARYVRILNAAQRLQAASVRLQLQTALMARNRSMMQAVAAEAMEYSKKNSAMTALLQQHGSLLEQLNLKHRSTTAQPR